MDPDRAVYRRGCTASGDQPQSGGRPYSGGRRRFMKGGERGGMKNLIMARDDANDQMQQTAKAVVRFEVRTFEPPMREMGTLLVECANLVGRALPLLSAIGDNVAMLTAITEELTKAEGRVDDLHDIVLKELVLTHPHPTTRD